MSFQLDKQRRQRQRQRREQFDEHMQTRSGGVLERIADRVARHRRLVGGAALAAVRAGFNELLRVVPGAASVIHIGGEDDAGDRTDHQ